ncbi:C-Jun-amino-terminal kinase-interacting protein 1-like isoform X3 [Ostrea edulis]|uniref:C-Jun-amino-terminal kinase-interacting protein 1-like isoform X3 n=1 Tax=Ostrea edulis TaxID=37623 RepID=UPI0020950E3C|nr:C-Jun-amino-terminal kinase-interacting protein 1-like isoform X3 [Ostrea edulis]
MLKLNCFLPPDYSLRLTHDISPENFPEDLNDYDSDLKKEQFILSCLTTRAASPEVECTKDEGDEKQALSPLQIQQKTLEQLNNVINNQYHSAKNQSDRVSIKASGHVGPEEVPLIHEVQQTKTAAAKRPSTLTSSHVVKPVLTRGNRKPRKLPTVPSSQNHVIVVTPNRGPDVKPINERCLADELQEALLRGDNDDVFLPEQPPKQEKVYPKFSKQYLDELKNGCFNSVSGNTAPCLSSDNVYLSEDSVPDTRPRLRSSFMSKDARHLSGDSGRSCSTDSSSDADVEAPNRTEKVNSRLCSITSQKRTEAKDHNKYIASKEEVSGSSASSSALLTSDDRKRRDSGDDPSRRSSSVFGDTRFLDLEVTHRGMHRFVPRHKDEIPVEIGDPIHVFRLDDDLWCEGVNLRSFRRGIFPSMYATDLKFLEEPDTDEDGNSHFNMRFLGSVEVSGHKGDDVLCQAINKVALSRRSAKASAPPPIVSVEISQYGIRMLDKSKLGHETDDHFTHFFALKNISFCGFHPRNERYFGFITKHPTSCRFACHVFLGNKSTRSVSDALGDAFKRFYQEYMAFTHPTEDIYME